VRAYDLVRLAAARGVLRRRRIDHTPCGFADGPSPAPASFAFITAKIFGYVDGHDAVILYLRMIAIIWACAHDG
jgi:hypothetical protein